MPLPCEGEKIRANFNKKPISLQAKFPHQEGLRIQSRNIPVETRIPIEKESHQAIHKMFSLLAHRLMGFLYPNYKNLSLRSRTLKLEYYIF